MKNAVIYARYSCERQTEQSIEGQLRVCQEYAKKNDYLILDTYIDRAMSGTNDNRIAFQKMLRDSNNKKWEVVLVYKGDRFARNRIESVINKKYLKDNGVKLISATENIPDSPEGIIMESLLEGLAEYYSVELAQKIKRGMTETVAKGNFTGGYIPYGYDIVNKKWVVNQNEAKIVNQIYEDYANGKIVKDIIFDLTEKGIYAKNGKPFAKNTVYNILKSQKYIGIFSYGGKALPNIIPAIVPLPIYERVQEINEKNKKAPARNRSDGNYLLSGKLYCGECGSLMTGEAGTSRTGEVYHYYKCFTKKKFPHKCTFPSLKKDKIEDIVFNVCLEVLNGELLSGIVDKAIALNKKENEENLLLKSLTVELKQKQKALSNVLKAIENGIFNDTTKDRMKELEEDVKILQYKIDFEKNREQNILTKKDYLEFFNSFLENQNNNQTFKETIIEFFVRKVVIFRDKIRISFNYTPKDKKPNKDVKKSIDEIKEAQEEYKDGSISSNLFSFSQPSRTNLNTFIFVKKEYFGVWIVRE